MAKAAPAVTLSALGRFRRYAVRVLGDYLEHPGDGRVRPQITARDLLGSLLLGQVLRESSHHAIEALVHSSARRALGVMRQFGDDALGYFTERLAVEPMRAALAGVVRQAKRNKAFENTRWIGLALDGTGAGGSAAWRCSLCHPVTNAAGTGPGHTHRLSLISVVGTGLTLPCDVEPYGPGDSELRASERLLDRTVGSLGRRFADYVVVDGAYANAPFLHRVRALGLHVVARLKDNLPTLMNTARQHFEAQPPHQTFRVGADRVEIWDADGFDPWENLNWVTVRVLRYRQHKPDGTVHEAYWLTEWPIAQIGPQALFAVAKSRWEIENQGFNVAKNRHDLEHVHHHHPTSLLIEWLVVMLALTLERLYRLRYLHRGSHPPRAAIELVRAFWLSLATAVSCDSS